MQTLSRHSKRGTVPIAEQFLQPIIINTVSVPSFKCMYNNLLFDTHIKIRETIPSKTEPICTERVW
jgi:hypothetical protein